MKVAVFSSKPYDRRFLLQENRERLDFVFFEVRLDEKSVSLADGFPVVCVFVNDFLDANILLRLYAGGTRMIALRCAGFNNVDFDAVRSLGMTVARVPAYSPNSISEFTIGLILALARKIVRASLRAKEGNFSLDGLLGYNICDRTVGIFGTGKIGAQTAKALLGFGCKVLACDQFENENLKNAGVVYCSKNELFEQSDIISLHCPLTEDTWHLVNEESIGRMRSGVMLINTSRGALIESDALMKALKSGKIGSLAIDVYENENEFFFEDFSDKIIQDDFLARIINFPNVIVTSHLAFFTEQALTSIAKETVANILAFERCESPPGILTVELANTGRPKTPAEKEAQSILSPSNF